MTGYMAIGAAEGKPYQGLTRVTMPEDHDAASCTCNAYEERYIQTAPAKLRAYQALLHNDNSKKEKGQ